MFVTYVPLIKQVLASFVLKCCKNASANNELKCNVDRNISKHMHSGWVQEMRDMMAIMKSDFDEALDEKRQEYEFEREEIKVLGSYLGWFVPYLFQEQCCTSFIRYKQTQVSHLMVEAFPMSLSHTFSTSCFPSFLCRTITLSSTTSFGSNWKQK